MASTQITTLLKISQQALQNITTASPPPQFFIQKVKGVCCCCRKGEAGPCTAM